jgi:hypothetical protein
MVNMQCRKYLDIKTDKKLVVPNTLESLQALLDRYPIINDLDPGSGEVSADDYYLTDADWSSRKETDRNMYVWGENIFQAYPNNDWANIYNIVYYANTCIENISKIDRSSGNMSEWDNIKGQALFYRAKAFLQAAFIWCKAYDITTSSEDPGIPLRLNADFNIHSTRATVQATYQRILDDLKQSAILLPVNPVHVIRPSKAAAYGLLARTYLSMRKYDSCFHYANLCLALSHTLMDYNLLDSDKLYPIEQFNPEVIHECFIVPPSPVSPTRARIDSNLYHLYSDNDLRKNIFFRRNTDGTFRFKGSYEGGIALFDGLATDEVYLMRSECYARTGNVSEAVNDLNTLLIKRYKEGTFIPVTASNADDALKLILAERRKELLMRGLRWMDLKRLNKEGRNITLTRIINGQTYILEPNDNRYALPIPDDVIRIAGIKQNIR